MFPIRDDNPHILTPIATYAIVAANALVWVLLQGIGTEPALAGSVCEFGLIPGELLQRVPAGTRIEIGPNAACVLEGSSRWHTAITSMFMHGSWFHLIGNMWFLWIFGNNVEDSMGHLRFVVFYLLCGLAAAGLQVLTAPESPVPMVGASGAIGGVMGAYILLYPRVHVHMLVFFGFFVRMIAVPAVLMLGYWFVIQFLSGVATQGADGGGVAFWAHVGGFAAGALLIWIFRSPRLLERHPYHGWRQTRAPSRSWHRVG
jgi:membrane associated rhomboid family serine protease